ncbi:Adenylate kinase isoenzyme 1 [Allomyces javanicus]|nr:Adenylate kinase isoenzyme 1 [Allomyces javanicus]
MTLLSSISSAWDDFLGCHLRRKKEKRSIEGEKPAAEIKGELPKLEDAPFDLKGRKIIFVLGGPGSGKGTNCTLLKDAFHLTHLSAGDLLRAEVASGSPLGSELNRMMAEGQLVPMDVTIHLLREAMARAPATSNGYLIDGFPRQVDQGKAFERLMHVVPAAVLFFDCSTEVMTQRLLKRGETSGRPDDNMASIKKRFKVFTEQTMPAVEYYRERGMVVSVHSEGKVEDVFARAKEMLMLRIPEWATLADEDHVEVNEA